jgi:hypothetical protein
MWVERIEEWTRSGQSAAEFAEGKPFTSGTLTWAASRLRNGDRGSSRRRASRPRPERQAKIQIAEVVVRRPARAAVGQSLVLEVGGAKVMVQRGFDRTLLRDVMLALRGEK